MSGLEDAEVRVKMEYYDDFPAEAPKVLQVFSGNSICGTRNRFAMCAERYAGETGWPGDQIVVAALKIPFRAFCLDTVSAEQGRFAVDAHYAIEYDTWEKDSPYAALKMRCMQQFQSNYPRMIYFLDRAPYLMASL
jgi:hypothetical protein